MVEKTKRDCEILGTELCDFMGCDGCEKCVFVDKIKGLDTEDAALRWRKTLELIPAEVDDLHTAETCVFCGSEKRTCYAEIGLGHIEPEHKKGVFLGMGKKIRSEIGSLIDLPIACCRSCKRKIIMQDVILYGVVVVILAAAIVILSVPAVGEALNNLHFLAPFLTLVVSALIGYLVGKVAAKAYIKNCEKSMIMNALEIPTIKKMRQAGWFPVPDPKKDYPQLHSAKKKIRENFRYFFR